MTNRAVAISCAWLLIVGYEIGLLLRGQPLVAAAFLGVIIAVAGIVWWRWVR